MNEQVKSHADTAEDSMGWEAGMSKRCYYEVLEVERTVGDGELKSAFRKLAMKWHPDRNPGDSSSEHRFKEINEAYEVLKDPDKRAAYDRFGHAAFEQGMGGGPHDFGPGFGSAFADIFEGIFGMAGGRGRGNRAERGADLRYNMEITLEEAFAGKAAQVRIPTSVSCEACAGAGAGLARYRGRDAHLRGLAGERLLQRDFHVVAQIGAALGAIAAPAAAGHAEDALEDIGEGRAETGPEIVRAAAHPLLEGGVSEAVVGGTLVGILENLVGLVDLLEAVLTRRIAGVAIGMPLHRQLTEGSLE